MWHAKLQEKEDKDSEWSDFSDMGVSVSVCWYIIDRPCSLVEVYIKLFCFNS